MQQPILRTPHCKGQPLQGNASLGRVGGLLRRCRPGSEAFNRAAGVSSLTGGCAPLVAALTVENHWHIGGTNSFVAGRDDYSRQDVALPADNER